MVSLVHDMRDVLPIKEETSTDLLNDENKQDSIELSPRSKGRPQRVRSGTSSVSSSLRSSDGGGGLLKLQLMGGGTGLLDSINLDDLPQESSRKTPRQRKPRSDAIERLHDSMSALEGISPEELVEEATRRRNERVNRYNNQRTHLSASLPANGPRLKMDPKFHASAPALVSGDLRLEGSNSSSRHVEDSIMERSVVIQTRDNSDFLWQRTPVGTECWGALELACKLEFDYRAPLQPRFVEDRKEIFDKCLQVWKKMELADEFVTACESVAPWTACCGMVRNDDRTIQETAETLRKGWIKNVNQRLKQKEQIFKLDVYVWSWHNATGKTKTNILLIRFLSARRGV